MTLLLLFAAQAAGGGEHDVWPNVCRIVRGQAATIAGVISDGSQPAAASSVTVTVTASDGTVLLDGLAAAPGDSDGVWQFGIPLTFTGTLDVLRVDWTLDGTDTITTFAEVCGGHLFSLAELRQSLTDARITRPLDQITDLTLAWYRLMAEETIEDSCNRAFVPRYMLETLQPGDRMLSEPLVTSLRSATSGNHDVTGLTASRYGILGGTSTLQYTDPITIGYEYGDPRPPIRVRRAALLLARSWMLQGPVDDRSATFNAGADGGTYGLVVPGRGGSWVGLPEVDATIDAYSLRAGIA